MKRLSFALVIVCLGTSHAMAECDDDDDGCVGLYVNGDFEITQGQVFSGLEDGVRAWGRDANLVINGGEIFGGGATGEPVQGGDGLDINFGAQVTVNAGQITGTDDGIKIKANSFVTVNGGTIHGDDDGISAVDDSLVRINGGDISGDVFGLLTSDRAVTTQTGGTITGNISLRDDSSMSIYGGNVGNMRTSNWSTLKIFGGNYTGLIEADNNSRVAVFLDPESGRLLDGSEFQQLINRPRDAQSTVLFLNTISEDTTFDGPERPPALGVVDGPDSQPTTVEFNGDRVFQDVLYLAEHSTANIVQGVVNGITVDDSSVLNLSGGEFRVSYGDEAILGNGRGTINMTGGRVAAYRDGIRLRGSSHATISAGDIDSSGSDGLDIATLATVSVEGGTIHGADDGVRVKDQAVAAILAGSILGDDDGLSVTGSGNVTITGGSITGQVLGMRVTDRAAVRVSGGSISGDVAVKGRSSLEMSGGTIEDDVMLSDATEITISDGIIQDDLRATDSVFITMSGGTIHGDLEARDRTTAEITGGTIGNRIQAQEQARVRVLGNNMQIQDGQITGTLIDGTEIQTSVLALDEAQVTAYNTIMDRQIVNAPAPDNVALLGDGPTLHVDFLSDSSIPGELLVSDDGRANILGGTIAGPITTLRNGIVAFYGTDLSLGNAGNSTFHVQGTLADGKQFAVQVIQEQHPNYTPRLYEVISSDGTIVDRTERVVAVLDGDTTGTVVDINAQSDSVFVTSVVDVRGTSTLNFRQGLASLAELVAWNNGHINVSGGVISGGEEAIFARDSGAVNVTGGEIRSSRDGIRVWDSSSLSVNAGSVTALDDAIDAKGSSDVTILGGEIFGGDEGIKAKGDAVVRVLGGAITGADNGISLEDHSRITIDAAATVSGDVYGMLTNDDTMAEIYGGSIAGIEASLFAAGSSVIDIFGGQFSGDMFAAGGTINVFGTDLDLDGNNLTGFLQDGSEIDLQAFASDGGQFVLSSDLDRPCDFDGNGFCDLADIDDLLYQGLGSADAKYDLDGSGSIDLGDRDEWLRQARAEQGDFDFDGDVDAADLNTLGQNWTATNLSSYAAGDSNGDGIANAADLNYLGNNWNAGRRAASAVPEPSSIAMLILLGILGMSAVRRRS